LSVIVGYKPSIFNKKIKGQRNVALI
jgi:hypothetical protein